MSNQSHGPSKFREPAGSGAVPSVGALRIVFVSPGVYALVESGTPAAAIVAGGAGVYAVEDGTTIGDLSAVRIGPTIGVLY